MFRVVDLFAGSGGFSLGFDLAGFKVDTHIELDRYASLTLKKNHPNSRVITDDVRFLNPHAVADHRNVDVLIGGPPCQGFSVAGSTQFGIEDDRNELVFWYLRFVEALKPKIAIVENVPNVLTKKSKGGVSVLDLVTEIAEEIGYMVSYQVMNAANYGVPQSRRRAFIVLHSPGTRFQFPPHTHEEVGERSLFADTKSYVTVGDALADLPLVDAGKVGSGLEYAKPAISEYQRYCRDNSNGIVNHDPMKHTERVIERFRVIQKGKSLKDVPLTHGQIAYGTGETVSKPFKYNNYRLDDQKCALAIPASFQSLFVHPFQDRNLTAREGARIMSFPDHYEFCGPKTMMSWESGLSQYNQIGNAVCPLVARALGYAVQDYLERAKNIEVFRSSKTLEKISQGLSKSRFTLAHAASAARNFRSHMPLSEDVISKSTYYQRSRKIFKIEGKEVPVDLVQIAFQLLNESSCLVCDAESAPFGDHTNGMNLLISKSDLQSLVDKGNDHGLDYHLRLLGSTDERLANEVATVLNDLDLVDIIKEANPRTGKQVKTMKLKTR